MVVSKNTMTILIAGSLYRGYKRVSAGHYLISETDRCLEEMFKNNQSSSASPPQPHSHPIVNNHADQTTLLYS